MKKEQPSIGTWRESAQLPATDVVRVPPSLRVELAATLPGSPCTAVRLLSDFKALSPGDVVVQTAAGSPVGSALSQLAARRGARVISIVDETGRNYAPTVERLKLTGSEVVFGAAHVDNAGVRAVLADMPAPTLAVHGGAADSCKALASVISRGCPVVTYCPGVADEAVLANAGAEGATFSLAEWMRAAGRDEVQKMVDEVAALMEEGELSGWLQRVEYDRLLSAVESGGVYNRKLVAVMDAV